MILALFLSCMVAGSYACTDDQCKDPELAMEMMRVKFLPDEEQLTVLCPKILRFLECEKDYLECQGQTLEEMASHPIEGPRAQGMLNGISLVRDFCDEDSSLNHDYLSNVDCFRDYVDSGNARKCRDDITKPIEEFFNQIYANEVDASDEATAEIRCLSDALEVACIVDNLGESCGSVAQGLAKTVLERMKPVVKDRSCWGVKNSEDLKSRFLDFLELEEPKKETFRGIFDIFKRRR